MSPEDMQTIVALLDHHNSRAEIVANQVAIMAELVEIHRRICCKSGITPEQQAEIIALNATQQQKVDALAADPK